MQIRRATKADLKSITALNVHVQMVHAEALPDLFKVPASPDFSAGFIAEWLADPESYFFIGSLEDEDIGYVYARLVNQPENEYRRAMQYIYIDQISVRPDYQRQGFGERLIQRVKELAVDKGIDMIALDVWSFNTNAQDFFARQGFVTFIQRMWLKPTPPT
jgi:ribosomal protein S18 acetylase RimI-like enzyme